MPKPVSKPGRIQFSEKSALISFLNKTYRQSIASNQDNQFSSLQFVDWHWALLGFLRFLTGDAGTDRLTDCPVSCSSRTSPSATRDRCRPVADATKLELYLVSAIWHCCCLRDWSSSPDPPMKLFPNWPSTSNTDATAPHSRVCQNRPLDRSRWRASTVANADWVTTQLHFPLVIGNQNGQG